MKIPITADHILRQEDPYGRSGQIEQLEDQVQHLKKVLQAILGTMSGKQKLDVYYAMHETTECEALNFQTAYNYERVELVAE